ncbi:MAG: response regulator [Phycisphaerales bacterium]
MVHPIGVMCSMVDCAAHAALGVVPQTDTGPSTGRIVAFAILLGILVVSLVAASLLRGAPPPAGTAPRDATLPPSPSDDSRATLALVADVLPVYFLRYATDGRVIGHCANAARIYGAALDEARRDGQALVAAIHPDDRSTWLAGFRNRTRDERGPVEVQYRVAIAGEPWRWIHEHVRPFTAASGATEWDSVCIDFTERRDAEERQREAIDMARLSASALATYLRHDGASVGDDAHRGGIAAALGAIGNGLRLSRLTFIVVDAADGSASAREEWTAPGQPSAMSRRQSQPPEKLGWWLPAAREGRISSFRRDRSSASTPPTALSMHPEVQSILIVPVLVRGTLRAALVAEDLSAPRAFGREEIGVVETAAKVVAHSIADADAVADAARHIGLQRELERHELLAVAAASVAHDLNNVIFAIGGQAAILRPHATNVEATAALDLIDRSLHATSELAATLAPPARPARPAERRPVQDDIAAGVRAARHVVPASIGLSVQFGASNAARGDLANATIEASPDSLPQIVLNLAVEARDEIVASGATSGVMRFDVALEPRGRAGDVLRIVLEADGPGIAMDARARALAPRASMRSVGDARLPLLACQRLVRELGGEIVVGQSSSLGGLMATVTLPFGPGRTDDDAERDDAADADSRRDEIVDDAGMGDIGLVLVVEDDAAVRRILTRAFVANQVEVIERSDAAEVEAILSEGAVHVDLVVMDVDLPGMSGMDCVRRLRARGCRVPVLFVTGGTTELDPELEPVRLLRKPFPLETLVAAARSLLESR